MFDKSVAKTKASIIHWTNKELMEYLDQFGDSKDIAVSTLLWIGERYPETRKAMGLEVIFEEE